MSNSELQECKIHRSFKGWELQECPSKKSFNVVAAREQKLEELQGGGRSGSLKVSSLLLLSYFLHSFVARKMTTMSPSSSFVSSCYKEKDDNNVVIIFIFFFNTNITPLYLGWGNDGTNSINSPSSNSISACNNKIYCCKIESREL